MFKFLVSFIKLEQAEVFTLPEINTTGVESCQAFKTDVAQFVPAQPVVGLTTAMFPENLASPIAACPAPCSL